jgi:phosphocarrier protein HPr
LEGLTLILLLTPQKARTVTLSSNEAGYFKLKRIHIIRVQQIGWGYMRVHEFMINSDIQRKDLEEISLKSSHFVSDITIVYKNNENENLVDVKSLLGMLLLPIKSGVAIRLIAKGKDEEEALNFVCNLFESIG